jgi:hypothetical protein
VNDQVLTILKGCLIAVLYLFLARVIWVVNRELRGTPAPTPQPVAPPEPAPTPRAAKEPKRAKAWRLDVREPPARLGQSFAVDTDEVTIGRGGGCAISIPDDTFASTLHARAFRRDDTLWLEDLGSTNGTSVNGAVIGEPVRLRKGDRIGIGGTVFEVGR